MNRDIKKFQDIPNIGPAMTRDFLLLGLKHPKDLKNKNPLTLYKKMCKISGTRQDPCVLDTYMAAIDFMNGHLNVPGFHIPKSEKRSMQIYSFWYNVK